MGDASAKTRLRIKVIFAATGHNFEAPMNDRLILVIGTAFGDVSFFRDQVTIYLN